MRSGVVMNGVIIMSIKDPLQIVKDFQLGVVISSEINIMSRNWIESTFFALAEVPLRSRYVAPGPASASLRPVLVEQRLTPFLTLPETFTLAFVLERLQLSELVDY